MTPDERKEEGRPQEPVSPTQPGAGVHQGVGRSPVPIHVYLPYIAATQDEKMYRVVMDRERWFSVVMGEEYKVTPARRRSSPTESCCPRLRRRHWRFS